MAVLSDADRAIAARRLGYRLFVESNQTAVFDFAQLLACIAAVDEWCEANAVAFNQSIPQPMRGAMSAAQKAELLAYVAMKRTGA